jgi:hypothetical protein
MNNIEINSKEIKNLSLGDTNIIDLCIRQAFSKNKIA